MAIKKTYYYTYKTVCIITGRYYYGMHSTRRLTDGYLGSGKILWHSIRKHGKENHKLEILQFYESREALAQAETELITEEVLKDPLCMNLQPGGGGGFSSTEHQLLTSKAGAKAISKRFKEDPELRAKFRELNRHRSSIGGSTGKGFLGKKWSDEHRSKILKNKEGKQEGSLNSQFGTIWITDENSNLKIKKESPIPEGWRRGRVKEY